MRPAIIDLINIRASQVNGCAFCVDMHSKEATIHGERPLRLLHVAIWRESTLFFAARARRIGMDRSADLAAAARRAAGNVRRGGARTPVGKRAVRPDVLHFMAINAWNRISVGFQTVPGTARQGIRPG